MGASQSVNEVQLMGHLDVKAALICSDGKVLDAGGIAMLIAVSIKAQNERKYVEPKFKRFETATMVHRLIVKFGDEALLKVFPGPRALEDLVQVIYELNRKGSDCYDLITSVEAHKNDIASTLGKV